MEYCWALQLYCNQSKEWEFIQRHNHDVYFHHTRKRAREELKRLKIKYPEDTFRIKKVVIG